MVKADDLVYGIKADARDFDRAVVRVGQSFDHLDEEAAAMARGVSLATYRAARRMERDFTQATTGIAAKLRSLRTYTGDARSLLGGTLGALTAIGPGTGVYGAVGGFAGGAALSGVAANARALADMNAEAERAGLTFEQFQELDFAFSKERVSIDALVDGFKELNLRADEFIRNGTGGGEEFFRLLGYSADELRGKLSDLPELLFDILDRSQSLGRAGQMRALDELLGGTGGEQYVQLLDAGTDALRASVAESRQLKIILSSDIAVRAQEVNARFETLSRIIGTNVKEGLVDVGELIVAIGDNIADWLPDAENFVTSLADAQARSLALEESVARALGTNPSPDAAPFADAAKHAADMAVEAERAERTLEEQEKIVDRLEAALARTAERAALEESQGAIANFEILRDRAGQIEQRLESARRALFDMAGVQVPLTSNGPPGIGPSGSAGSVPTELGRRVTGSHVDLRGLETSVANGVARVLNQFPGLSVSSAYRSPEYNARVGGARNSRHVQGDAVDLIGVNAGNVAAIVAALQEQGFRGFGYYNNGSLHADMGARRAWGPDRTAGSLGRTPAAFQAAVSYGPSMANVPASQKLAMSEAEYQAAQQAAEAAAAAAQAASDEQAAARERQVEAIARVNAQLREGIELEQIENDLLRDGKLSRDEVAAAMEAERESRARIAELQQAGVEVGPALEETIRREVALKHELAAANAKLRDATPDQVAQLDQLRSAFESIGQEGVDAFFAVIEGAQTADEAIKGLLKSLAKMALQGALFGSGPLGNLFGGGLFSFLGKADGGPVHAAGGGYISGPGGPRSDAIPAMLSNGEYVINARATRANRGLLDAINSGGLPGFADGGFISGDDFTALINDTPPPMRGGGPTTLHLTQNLSLAGANGDAEIRRIAMQSAEQGARAAVAHVERNFGTMAKQYNRHRG
ncbi:Phage-related minor tail protein [Stappia sp. 22II-S9-Z10]|nr:Phage-related minor tail protein [Stappia sp. 22II-S9-Z10]